jgi:hypothetical protein
MTKTVLAGIVCVLAGFLLGYAFRTHHEQHLKAIPLAGQSTTLPDVKRERESLLPPRPADEAFRHDKAEALVLSLRTQVAQLAERNRALQSNLSAATTSSQADATKIAIPKRLIPMLSLEAIGEGYSVGQDIVDVLEITDEEKKRIDDSLIEARAQLDELELKHSTVESQTDTSVTLTIAPFKPEGDAVRNKLTGDMRAVLGDERADVFMDFWARRETQKNFNHFGQATQHVTLTIQNSGQLRVDSKFRIETPTSSSSGARSQSYGKGSIPENYRHLFDIQ